MKKGELYIYIGEFENRKQRLVIYQNPDNISGACAVLFLPDKKQSIVWNRNLIPIPTTFDKGEE